MMKGIQVRDVSIAVVVLVLVLAAVGYFLFIRNNDHNNLVGPDGENINSRPVADAGFDVTVLSGQEVSLSGNGSYDTDDDELSYYWDMDSGVDSNIDGVTDNDRDLVGRDITYLYPFALETITYIVTLNVTDEKLSDTDTVRVTILANETQVPPEVTMSCRYQEKLPYLEAHFVVTVDDVTTDEMVSNFTYRLDDPNGNTIMNGTLEEIILLPPNATIRFVDSPPVGRVSKNDVFYIKEGENVIEGSWLYLFYKDHIDPLGSVELVKS